MASFTRTPRMRLCAAAVNRREWLAGSAAAGGAFLARPMVAAAAEPAFTTAKNGLQFADVEVGSGPAPAKVRAVFLSLLPPGTRDAALA